MQPPRVFVEDALDSIERVNRRLEGMDVEGLRHNDERLDGIERRLMVVAECFKALRSAGKEVEGALFRASPHINRVRTFADRIRHQYQEVSAEQVFKVVEKDLPVLKDALESLAQSPVLDVTASRRPPRRSGLGR